MKKIISKIRRKFPDASIEAIERAFVNSYVQQHLVELLKTCEIKRFLSVKDFDNVSQYVTSNCPLKGLDDLVIAFEVLVEDADKKNKGVVYTPPEIRDFISREIITKNNIPIIIDPACGCGAFLISASQCVHARYGISYSDIFQKYIWGCDIDAHSIEKCKVLLEVLALNDEKPVSNIKYNLIVGNALDVFSDKKYKGKFDVVLGNPPYVRSKNIDESIKPSLSNWKVVSGNVDLYIPFYQIGIELLNRTGRLGYISPNTFLQSVNGRSLRNYIRDQKLSMKIINFKETQTFAGVTHYTCISFIAKQTTSDIIEYSVYNDSLDDCVFTKYSITDYADDEEWRFGNADLDKLIYRIEHQPDKLANYNIRNGLATLCNDLYFFSVTRETKDYYYRVYKSKEYKIEKGICINIAKPNIMRCEKDLLTKGEKAIFPYMNGTIIPESILKSNYPYAYKFLEDNKKDLLNRDKGNTEKYPAWYAYGRTQGMRNTGMKILIPYMADRGVAIISEEEDLLFYCGYAAFSENITTLRILKILVESDVFWFYIKMTSKPYSKGFMALAKNYIKNFGIPNLSDEQKEALLIMKPEEREKYIAMLYDIDYTAICEYIRLTA